MDSFRFLPTSRIVNLIAKIERFAGGNSSALGDRDHDPRQVARSALAACLLDHTVEDYPHTRLDPLQMVEQIDGPEDFPDWHNYRKTLEVLAVTGPFGLDRFYSIGAELSSVSAFSTRVGPSRLRVPSILNPASPIVIEGVAAFTVDNQFNRLQSLSTPTEAHPLIVAAATFLVICQLQPLETANKRIALFWLRGWLLENGYAWWAERIIPTFLQHNKQYFASLKQAERSTFSDWSTLNVWLEFVLSLMADAVDTWKAETQSSIKRWKLNQTQLSVWQTVKQLKWATREKIASETGLPISTVKYTVTVLSKRGYLKREGQGRAAGYRLPFSE